MSQLAIKGHADRGEEVVGMTIETRYNIGDKVWYKGTKEISQDTISEIKVNIDCFGEAHIHYILWNEVLKEENDLFPTKEELIKNL